MGISGGLATLSGLASLGGGIAGAFGAGNANNVQLPPMFQMPNMGGAANNAFGTIGGLSSFDTSNIPEFRDVSNQLFHNPYSSTFQQGANVAGPMGQNAATNAFGAGGNLMGLGGSVLPSWAGSIINQGMDPQSALYARTLQQVQDQTRAGNAASGVGTTPYGAGIEAQQVRDFNLDWQNQQLQRQIAAGGAAGGLIGIGANAVGQGAGLQANAPVQYLGASGIPYGTFGQIGQGQLNALTGLQGYGQSAAQIPQQQIQDYFGYLTGGNQAGSVANQTAGLGLQQNQQSFNQYAQAGQGIGAGLYGLSGGSNPWGSIFSGPSAGNIYGQGGAFNTPFMRGGWGYQ